MFLSSRMLTLLSLSLSLSLSSAADIKLAEAGRKDIMLSENEMPGLMNLRHKFGESKPLKVRHAPTTILHDNAV